MEWPSLQEIDAVVGGQKEDIQTADYPKRD
jgi:hypothetical protein